MTTNDTEKSGQAAGAPLIVHAQYIKDLSFENPQAPESFRSEQRPELDVDFSIDCRKVESTGHDRTFEVTLGVTAKAQRGGKALFVAEVQYALVVSLLSVPAEHEHPVLFIDMPSYLFPYVRQLIGTVTQQAGYMPLLLNPIDFRAFYVERFVNEKEKASA